MFKEGPGESPGVPGWEGGNEKKRKMDDFFSEEKMESEKRKKATPISEKNRNMKK